MLLGALSGSLDRATQVTAYAPATLFRHNVRASSRADEWICSDYYSNLQDADTIRRLVGAFDLGAILLFALGTRELVDFLHSCNHVLQNTRHTI